MSTCLWCSGTGWGIAAARTTRSELSRITYRNFFQVSVVSLPCGVSNRALDNKGSHHIGTPVCYTGVFVHSIATGTGPTSDIFSSFFGDVNEQVMAVVVGITLYPRRLHLAGEPQQRPQLVHLQCLHDVLPSARIPFALFCMLAAPQPSAFATGHQSSQAGDAGVQVANACLELRSMPELEGGYVAVGFSQGAYQQA